MVIHHDKKFPTGPEGEPQYIREGLKSTLMGSVEGLNYETVTIFIEIIRVSVECMTINMAKS